MNTPIDSATEIAKAVGELATTAGKGIDACREAGGFIARFVAGPLAQGMGKFEDKLIYMRWERQVRLIRRAEEVLKEIGLNEPTRAVPLKIAIPIFQAASMEEDDQLQDRWIALLVNAANANSNLEIRRVHISILEQITSLEARILDVIYSIPLEKCEHLGVVAVDLPITARPASIEDHQQLKVEPTREVTLALSNLTRVSCLRSTFLMDGGETFRTVFPTVLGSDFVTACRLQRSC